MIKKIAIAAGAVPFLVLGLITNAYATADSATVSAVGGAAGTLKDTLLEVGTTVLPYAAAVLALSIGWRFARKFVRG